ncbi:MAG TPA: MBL fold metallo-hydrolase, partial [Anaerolineae bacterium]|nr:MBL fold metallo-hydrolase [Anaerolineae bacterium]
MKLQFIGAVRTVTGSMHRLQVNGAGILFDCGQFQGHRDESRERNAHFGFDPAGLSALVLSHAHIDHSGNIPTLVRAGFDGNIYCMSATRDLCAAMLRDSAHIQEQDAAYLNKKRTRRGEPPITPLYTTADAVASLRQFVGLSYERAFDVAPGVRATFYDAGHILGSALCALD